MLTADLRVMETAKQKERSKIDLCMYTISPANAGLIVFINS